MSITWRYTNTGKSIKKHAFSSLLTGSSICGYHIPWYAPNNWLEDKEGLDSREPCRNCLHCLAEPGTPVDLRSRLASTAPEPRSQAEGPSVGVGQSGPS